MWSIMFSDDLKNKCNIFLRKFGKILTVIKMHNLIYLVRFFKTNQSFQSINVFIGIFFN